MNKIIEKHPNPQFAREKIYLLDGEWEISLNGERMRKIRGDKIAMVFQEDRLLPGCTVLENLRLVAPERSDTELIALLGELGLSGWENARPGKLSGGMRRRVAILRAVLADGDLLLLDEPFKGLDEATRASVAAYLRAETAGRTVIMVTHDPDEVALMGGSLLKMEPAEQGQEL